MFVKKVQEFTRERGSIVCNTLFILRYLCVVMIKNPNLHPVSHCVYFFSTKIYSSTHAWKWGDMAKVVVSAYGVYFIDKGLFVLRHVYVFPSSICVSPLFRNPIAGYLTDFSPILDFFNSRSNNCF